MYLEELALARRREVSVENNVILHDIYPTLSDGPLYLTDAFPVLHLLSILA